MVDDTQSVEIPDTYIKPGWKTTEFWVMLMSVAFGCMVLFGVITNTESNTILAYINNIMGSLVTIVSVTAYILSRGKAKQGQVNYTKLVNDIEKLVNAQNNKMIQIIDNNQRMLLHEKALENLNEKK